MCVVCVFFYICAFYAVFFLKHIDVLVCFSFLYVDNFGVIYIALLHDCVSYFTYEHNDSKKDSRSLYGVVSH